MGAPCKLARIRVGLWHVDLRMQEPPRSELARTRTCHHLVRTREGWLHAGMGLLRLIVAVASRRVVARGIASKVPEPRSSMQQTKLTAPSLERVFCRAKRHKAHVYKYMHTLTCIHTYITLHDILHYIALHVITIHYIASHYITLHYITLHCIALHFTLHYITLLPPTMIWFWRPQTC